MSGHSLEQTGNKTTGSVLSQRDSPESWTDNLHLTGEKVKKVTQISKCQYYHTKSTNNASLAYKWRKTKHKKKWRKSRDFLQLGQVGERCLGTGDEVHTLYFSLHSSKYAEENKVEPNRLHP